MLEASPLEKALGIDYYICDKLDLSSLLEFKKSPETFKVFELSLDGVKASPELCSDEELTENITGDYAYYIMCKRGVDAFYAIQLLKKVFRTNIGYAGLKDTDSYSCQFISLNVKHLRNSLRNHYSLGPLKLCFYKFLNHPIKKGYLLGNMFNIFLLFKSTQHVDEDKLRSINEILQSTTLLNYYGYQRFGTIRPTTHLVGSAIIKRRWDEAVRLIAGSPHPSESHDVVAAREEFEVGNYYNAFKLFPHSYWIERVVCKAIMRYRDPLKTINSLPMEIKLFYVEAYQSYLFNRALSNALRTLGSAENVRNVCETLVVPGSNLRLRDDICISLVRKVMEDEGISQKDFVINELKINAKSYVRESTFKVSGLDLRLAPNGIWMEFILPRSSYASIILREILKRPTY